MRCALRKEGRLGTAHDQNISKEMTARKSSRSIKQSGGIGKAGVGGRDIYKRRAHLPVMLVASVYGRKSIRKKK